MRSSMSKRKYPLLKQSEVKTLNELLKEKRITKIGIANEVNTPYSNLKARLSGYEGMQPQIAEHIYKRLEGDTRSDFLKRYFSSNDKE